ncbi:hypothetical protein O6H91_06G093200 [Diphasiastrum complanatum]|uniref:Uncharacterized protein n=1 Tax=Diphasiastrum complanatum TaxID=34168 RepID=A0ACC2DGH0_DIPCM|nr:hypothetical protein O6H91_06G093200 [Diphasiastrum complanatum]
MMNPTLVVRGLPNTSDRAVSIFSSFPVLGQQQSWQLARSVHKKFHICLPFRRAGCSIVSHLSNGDVGSLTATKIDSIQGLKGVFPGGMRRAEVKVPGLVLLLHAEEVVGGGEEAKLKVEMVSAAVTGGITVVALEAGPGSGLTDSQLYFAACVLKEALRGRAKLMVVERADIAAAVGADGVLLSDQGLPTVVARRMMQNALSEVATLPLVARIVTSAESAQVASKEGSDFLILRIPEVVNTNHLVKSVSNLVTIPVFVEASFVSGNSSNIGILSPSLEFVESGANGLVLTGWDVSNAGGNDIFNYIAALTSTIDLAIQQRASSETTLDADDLVQMPLSSEGEESHALNGVLEKDVKLDLQETKLLQEERLLLSSTIDLIKEASPEMEEVTLLVDALAQLDEIFLLVVVGEFNSGKSSLINALLGDRFLKEGVLPTTNEITLLKHSRDSATGEERFERHPDGHFMRYLSVELLKQINVVDTPGTNVILPRQQRLTEEFVPRADLVFFVLAVDRPLSESEVSFLRYIRRWEKKIIFILNKMDVLSQPSELEEVIKFVEDNIRRLLSIDQVLMFPVSARHGLQSKLAATREDGTLDRELLSKNDLWESSGFETLENFILGFLQRSTDAGAERLRLKLETPLNIAAAILGACERKLSLHGSKAEADLKEIARFEEQLQRFQLSLKNDSLVQVQHALAGIEAAKGRADKFIDSILRLSNIESIAKYLIGVDRVETMPVSAGFKSEVIGSAYSDTESSLNTYISWLESNTLRQLDTHYKLVKNRWPDVKVEVGTHKKVPRNEIQYSTPSSLDVLREFDIKAAEIVLEQEIREVVLGTFGGLGAAGVSASVLTSILPTTLEDLVALGLCSAGGFAGIWNLPPRRAEIKKKIQRIADSLARKIETAMQLELRSSVEEVKSNLDFLTNPYRDAAQIKVDSVTKLQNHLSLLSDRLILLRQRVQNIGA